MSVRDIRNPLLRRTILVFSLGPLAVLWGAASLCQILLDAIPACWEEYRDEWSDFLRRVKGAWKGY